MTIAALLPKWIKNKLFGEREKYGIVADPNDQDWVEWLTFYHKFYKDTQKKGVSKHVNDSGYRIMRHTPLQGKTILEIGPGDLPHTKYWIDKPDQYFLCDIREEFLTQSQKRLSGMGIKSQGYVINSPHIPLPDNSVDIVVGFYVLEHLTPFEDYLHEICRILKPGGILIAGIPTEGGLGWGLGRFFSSRRYILKNSALNPDKLICWEHPNYAQDILNTLDGRMMKQKRNFWPFLLPLIDVNLIISFIYQNP